MVLRRSGRKRRKEGDRNRKAGRLGLRSVVKITSPSEEIEKIGRKREGGGGGASTERKNFT